eukprot:6173451-Pleurochrysis_carterae.AAC.4
MVKPAPIAARTATVVVALQLLDLTVARCTPYPLLIGQTARRAHVARCGLSARYQSPARESKETNKLVRGGPRPCWHSADACAVQSFQRRQARVVQGRAS